MIVHSRSGIIQTQRQIPPVIKDILHVKLNSQIGFHTGNFEGFGVAEQEIKHINGLSSNSATSLSASCAITGEESAIAPMANAVQRLNLCTI